MSDTIPYIKLRTINNQIVKPVKIPVVDKTKIKGVELFDELYANVFMLAKKKSGKTVTIKTILSKCAGKSANGEKTKIIIFASTVHKDATWKAIVKSLIDKEYQVETHMSIVEDGVNHLENLCEMLQQAGDESEDEEDAKAKKKEKRLLKKYIKLDNEEEEQPPRKPKLIAPEYIVVFDDLSTELKDRCIPKLLKRNRHFKMKVLISSQYWNDLEKSARLQLDYILMWPKLPDEKVEQVHTESDLSVSWPLFHKLYANATANKYNFLYVDVRNDAFRKNFDKQYDLPEHE